MDHQKVSNAVESICAMGCTTVNAIIETLESGNTVEAVEDFSDAELIALTNELKAIMAVYDRDDD